MTRFLLLYSWRLRAPLERSSSIFSASSRIADFSSYNSTNLPISSHGAPETRPPADPVMPTARTMPAIDPTASPAHPRAEKLAQNGSSWYPIVNNNFDIGVGVE